MKTGKKLLTGSLLALCAALQGRGQIAPRPFSASFVRKGGCSFEQPPFAISIRFEQKGNQPMTKEYGRCR